MIGSMLAARSLWKPVLQRLVTGRAARFRMTPRTPPFPVGLERAGLYLHVPFCRNLCSFCPYNRVEYDPVLFGRYERAVCQEIEAYAPHLRGTHFVSLYVGGGTPTVNPSGLLRILEHLRKTLDVSCDICVELHPAHMDEEVLVALKDVGVTLLSVGVESTSDQILERIGRNHSGEMALQALHRARAVGFDTVNADLMFALPGQTLDHWKHDVLAVLAEGVDQVSTYPMFTFPYSERGRQLGTRVVERPDGSTIRSMLRFTDEACRARGLRRCAVWSWQRPSSQKFSSITRHHYVGFGPSAATMNGAHFYVNTFDVAAYADSLPERLPVALSMEVNRRLEMAYWLYWRVYELFVSDSDFRSVFGAHESLTDRFGHLFGPLRAAGLARRATGGYAITPTGAYWIHRLQNEYSLNYINRLWGTCRRSPWPAEAVL